MKKALVCGAGGFIGSHLVRRLKKDGYWVRGVDLKYPEFSETDADEFIKGDLRNLSIVDVCVDGVDEVYQLAADMGGADFIFTGENDSEIMHNSAMVNLNIVDSMKRHKVKKVFYSSSACMYPEDHQLEIDVPALKEDMAYPGNPDSEYGWEKLFSERLYLVYAKNEGFRVRIARFHNIFGPEGTYDGGREKAPAALCRKVIESKGHKQPPVIEVYGDGKQTRSFLYIDECVEGIRRIMESDCTEPLNLGSDEVISINDFAKMIIDISSKEVKIKNIDVQQVGVRGRNSDNTLIKEKLNWYPTQSLRVGIEKTYEWIESQLNNKTTPVGFQL
ncbi:NAD-dependent dehydratase [Candidatus Pacearchaeota archaeon]|jgi:nucleoside-diphosphate-sugar epimerase|nr:NAD-dependent dehydratase [Candidatus Pacearchaeota archaeon]